MELRIEPILPDHSTGTKEWYAFVVNDKGTPQFDGSGPTIELALASLIKELCQEIEDRS